MSDNQELLTIVRSLLYYADDSAPVHQGTPGYAYLIAKQRARNGDLAPLRKLLIDLTGDPAIADYIAQPSSPPWPKHARQDYARSAPLEQLARRIESHTVRRIREIIEEENGGARVPRELIVEIAAQVLDCSQDEVREIIKRG